MAKKYIVNCRAAFEKGSQGLSPLLRNMNKYQSEPG